MQAWGLVYPHPIFSSKVYMFLPEKGILNSCWRKVWAYILYVTLIPDYFITSFLLATIISNYYFLFSVASILQYFEDNRRKGLFVGQLWACIKNSLIKMLIFNKVHI